MKEQEYKALSIQEFTKAATSYEGDHAGIYAMCKKDYPDILQELESEPWQALLDAGCGPGPMITLLSQKFPDRQYTGLDLTPKMIEVAKAKRIPNATFIIGDCEALPFGKGSFDVIICANSFHHYPNPQRFFDGVARVLRPGGRLILRDYTADGLLLWLCNHVEMPLARAFGHGDVAMVCLRDVEEMCVLAGLIPEKLEKRKGMRMHCVIRKPRNDM